MGKYLRDLIQRAIDAGDLMSTAQVAELLQVNQAVVARWCYDGKLPAIKLPQPKIRTTPSGERGIVGTHVRAEWLVVHEDFLSFRAKQLVEERAFEDRCLTTNEYVEGPCIRERNHTGLHRAGKGRALTWRDRDPGTHKETKP